MIITMNIDLLTFSPTKTGLKICRKITEGTGVAVNCISEIDLTKAEIRRQPPAIDADLCIICAPCYEARIPPVVRDFFSNSTIDGKNTPTVAVVVYGNRTLGIALKQLVEKVANAHFKVIATGSFVGEHSYASDFLPLGLGRPDAADLEAAKSFGQQIGALLMDAKGADLQPIKAAMMPGSIQWMFRLIPEGFLGSFGSPSAISADCIHCGLCEKWCPVEAIDSQTLEIDRKKCIHCMACVKLCPSKARKLQLRTPPIVKRFMKPGFKVRREPKTRIAEKNG